MASTKVPIELSSTPGIVDNSNATAITIDSSENVGIGTGSPFSKLDVRSISAGSEVFAGIFANDGTTAGSKVSVSLVTGSDGTAGRIRSQIVGDSDGDNNGYLAFNTRNSGTQSERLRIDSSGNVGIANTSPSSYSASANNLVVGTSGDTGITIVSGTASNGQLKFADGTSGDATGRGIIDYNHASDHMALKTAATERMRITSNGFTKHSNTGTYDTYAFADDSHQFVSDDASHSTLWVTNTNASYASTSMLRLETARGATSAFTFLAATTGNLNDDQFLLKGDGNAYADGSWSGGGADYAEYFEWSDGNTDNEDRRGYTVVLSENKIRKSTSEDNPNNIIGVVSGNPSVIGDSDIGAWKNKYQKDDYGSYIKDENGERIINDEYDETQDYITREDRQEWDVIGLMGKVRINKGQAVGDRWIKMRDISDTVEEWLIK